MVTFNYLKPFSVVSYLLLLNNMLFCNLPNIVLMFVFNKTNETEYLIMFPYYIKQLIITLSDIIYNEK